MADLGRRDYINMAVITLFFAIGALAAGQFLMTETPRLNFEDVSVVSSEGNKDVISRTNTGQPDSIEIRFESMEIEYRNLSLESSNPTIDLDIEAELTSPSTTTQTGQILKTSYPISSPDGRISPSDTRDQLQSVDIVSKIVDNPDEFFDIDEGSSQNYNLEITYSASVSGVDDAEDINARGQSQIPVSVINNPD